MDLHAPLQRAVCVLQRHHVRLTDAQNGSDLRLGGLGIVCRAVAHQGLGALHGADALALCKLLESLQSRAGELLGVLGPLLAGADAARACRESLHGALANGRATGGLLRGRGPLGRRRLLCGSGLDGRRLSRRHLDDAHRRTALLGGTALCDGLAPALGRHIVATGPLDVLRATAPTLERSAAVEALGAPTAAGHTLGHAAHAAAAVLGALRAVKATRASLGATAASQSGLVGATCSSGVAGHRPAMERSLRHTTTHVCLLAVRHSNLLGPRSVIVREPNGTTVASSGVPRVEVNGVLNQQLNIIAAQDLNVGPVV